MLTKVNHSRSLYLIGAVIFVAGFLLRILYNFNLDITNPIRGDAAYYVQYATNLIQHGVFSKSLDNPPVPDSYWSPGYPGFLVISFLIASGLNLDQYHFTLLLQAFTGGLICALTFFTGRLFLPTGLAITAATLTILSPHLISHGGYILTESWFSLLLLTAIYLFIKAETTAGKSLMWAAAGIATGLAYLTNPVIAVLPFLLVVGYWLRQRKANIPTARKIPHVYLVTFLLFAVAWGIRGAISVPATTETTANRAFINFVIGSHYNFHDMWQADPRNPENPADKDIAIYKSNHSGFLSELAGRISRNPLHYGQWYFLQKPVDLWGWDILVGQGDVFVYPINSTLFHTSRIALAIMVFMKNIHYWLFGAALIGFLLALKETDRTKKQPLMVLYTGLISISAVYVVLQADGRYSVPMRPEMYLCAVYACQKLYHFVKNLNEKSKNKTTLPAVAPQTDTAH